MKQFALNLTAMALGLLLFALLGEAALRLLGVRPKLYLKPDLVAGTRLTPGAEYLSTREGFSKGRISSKGLRDHEYPYEKPSNVYRIIVLGDSYTEALQVDLARSFTKLLERRLNEKPPVPSIRYEVLNMGVSGYGTANAYYLYVSEGVRYQADLVVLAFVPQNDFRNNSRELDGYAHRPYFVMDDQGRLREDLRFREGLRRQLTGWRAWTTGLRRRSALVSITIERLKVLFGPQKRNVTRDEATGRVAVTNDWNIYLKKLPPPWAAAVRVTEGILLRLRDRVRADGADFLVVSITGGMQLNDRLLPVLDSALGPGAYALTERERTLAEFARRERIELLPLYPEFRRRYEETGVFFHGFPNAGGEGSNGHWNEKGHLLAAETMDVYLRTYIPQHLHVRGRQGTAHP